MDGHGEDASLTEPARLLLLASLLAADRIISNNGKAFLKEMVLRRDPRLASLLQRFEAVETVDSDFMELVHQLIQNESQAVFNELFADTSLEVGKRTSKEERERLHLGEEKNLIYGEVDYASFYRILRKINPGPNLTFYDLGSGTGKAVFAARFTQDFAKCIGIEILSGLHDRAFGITHRYNSEYRHLLCSTQRQHAAVYKGSFVEFDWSDGDVVFANSTCFDDELMVALSRKAEKLKPGAIVVTFTKGLKPDRCFQLLESKRERMSWGPATVFIHRRLNEDGSVFQAPRLNLLPSDAVEYDDSYPGGEGEGEEEDEDEEDEEEDDDEEEEDDEEDEEDEDEEEDGEGSSWYDRLNQSDGGRDALRAYKAYQDAEQRKKGGESYPPSPPSPSSPSQRVPGLASPRRSSDPLIDGLASPQDAALLARKLRGRPAGGARTEL